MSPKTRPERPLRPARALRRLCLTWVCIIGSTLAAETPATDAAAIYQRNCAACHGDRGDGKSRAAAALAKPPRDFTTDHARRDLPRDFMIAIVRDGKHDTPMAGRKTRLSEDEIEAVVDFVRAAFMPPEPGTRLAHGRELYRDRCAACHGDRGQGGVLGHTRIKVPALSRLLARRDLTRERMLAALTAPQHGPMKSETLQLPASDVEDVSDYVRAAFIEGVAP